MPHWIMLPEFLIVGAPRSGTSSLNHYLRQHPAIHMAKQKEVRFFDRNWEKGINWYRAQFRPQPGQKAGEASPEYMYSPEARQRIAETLPHARLVAVLRNPIDQTYSRYLMAHVRGRDERSFLHAMDDYVSGGQYIDHLIRLSDAPLHVIITEDLAADPASVYSHLCRFLDVDDTYRPPDLGRVVNRHLEVRSLTLRAIGKRAPKRVANAIGKVNHRVVTPPPMPAEAREQLKHHFTPYNERLELFLGRDLEIWHS